MCSVMTPVPGIQREELVEIHLAALRMLQRTRKVARLHGAEHAGPAIVHVLEQRERRVDRSRTRVFELCPFRFFVWLDRRMLFGQRELESDERIHMTVWHVVHDLSYRPAVGAIGRIELSIIEPGYGSAEMLRCLGDGVDGVATLNVGESVGALKAADGVGEVGHGREGVWREGVWREGVRRMPVVKCRGCVHPA